MFFLGKVSTVGWKPTAELKFIEGRLVQKWKGDLNKWMIGDNSLQPQVTILQDVEWREVPGQVT